MYGITTLTSRFSYRSWSFCDAIIQFVANKITIFSCFSFTICSYVYEFIQIYHKTGYLGPYLLIEDWGQVGQHLSDCRIGFRQSTGGHWNFLHSIMPSLHAHFSQDPLIQVWKFFQYFPSRMHPAQIEQQLSGLL